MQLHFYAPIETINAIQKGDVMFVFTKEGKSDEMIHISIDLENYSVEKVVAGKHMFKVYRKY